MRCLIDGVPGVEESVLEWFRSLGVRSGDCDDDGKDDNIEDVNACSEELAAWLLESEIDRSNKRHELTLNH